LAKALKQKDEVVTEVMNDVTTYLAVLAATIVNFLDPEIIVIGGGVAEALGERLVKPIREQASQWFIQQKNAEAVRIVPAELGDYSIVLGGAAIAWERLGEET
jgi:glucokinase